jgi:hypothetical protein
MPTRRAKFLMASAVSALAGTLLLSMGQPVAVAAGEVEPVKAEVITEAEAFDEYMTSTEVDELAEAKTAVDDLPSATVANTWIDPLTGAVKVGVTENANTEFIREELNEQGLTGYDLVDVDTAKMNWTKS